MPCACPRGSRDRSTGRGQAQGIVPTPASRVFSSYVNCGIPCGYPFFLHHGDLLIPQAEL